MTRKSKDSAVSPVVGVMLMLVVTIIIAAIVSGYAGGLAKSQTKAPQATIQGTFSVTSGLKIIHAGGDAIPTSGMTITVKNGPTFGPNLEAMSSNILNLQNVTNSAGTPIQWSDGGYNITSFNSGDTFYVNITNVDPMLFQPTVAPSSGYSFDGTHYVWTTSTGSGKYPFWKLCFVNQDNIGKTFYLDVNDKATGALISRAVIPITG